MILRSRVRGCVCFLYCWLLSVMGLPPHGACAQDIFGTPSRCDIPQNVMGNINSYLGVVDVSDADLRVVWKRTLSRFKRRKNQLWRRLPCWVMNDFRHRMMIKSLKNARRMKFRFCDFPAFLQHESISRRHQRLRRWFWGRPSWTKTMITSQKCVFLADCCFFN